MKKIDIEESNLAGEYIPAELTANYEAAIPEALKTFLNSFSDPVTTNDPYLKIVIWEMDPEKNGGFKHQVAMYLLDRTLPQVRSLRKIMLLRERTNDPHKKVTEMCNQILVSLFIPGYMGVYNTQKELANADDNLRRTV